MLVLTGRQGAQSMSGERRLMMFGSNDYLGLAGDPAVVRATTDAIETYGTGLAMNHCLLPQPRCMENYESTSRHLQGRNPHSFLAHALPQKSHC